MIAEAEHINANPDTDEITVLSVGAEDSQDAIHKWVEQEMELRPWETRN